MIKLQKLQTFKKICDKLMRHLPTLMRRSYLCKVNNSNISDDITDEQGRIFEKKLGESLIELLWEAAENENRSSNTEESNTE